MARRFELVMLAMAFTMNAWCQAGQPNPPAPPADPPEKAAAAAAPAAIQAGPKGKDTQGNYSPGGLLRNLAGDQKAIWTSPARLRLANLEWLVPLAGVGAGLLATDSDSSRHLSNSPNRINRSNEISNFGVGALGGAAGGMYLWGKFTGNRHEQETGFLAIESLASALAVNNAVNFAAGRERPGADHARGRFGTGGRSFPSNHAAAAWSIASVVAHEYPGLLTKLAAYGLAGAVSASRVTAKQHFPSDVFFASTIGWFVGEQIYRAHHDPEAGGGVWNSFAERNDDEGSSVANRASAFVPLESWVYPAIARLAAEGYIRTAMLGMRPWTRQECARLVEEAEDRIHAEEKDPRANVAEGVAALEKEFAGELGSGGASRLELTSLYSRVTGISGPPLRDGYHFGQTIVNDEGRPYGEGANVASGFTAQALAGPFVVYVNGEYQHAPEAPPLPASARAVIPGRDFGLPPMPALATPAVTRFRLLDAYVAMGFHDWQISFGEQSLWWGPGKGSAMMWTDNAEPVEMLRMTRVSPFKLPGIFGLMGPMRTEFFIGRLAGHEFIFGVPTGLEGQWGQPLADQPMIHGEKFSFKPSPNLEFGFSRTRIFAGAGVPFTLGTFRRSMISAGNGPPGCFVSSPRCPSLDPGDNRSGFDMTYRLPGLRNWVTFYADSFTDDEFSPVAYFDRSANSAGLYLPRLPKLERWDLRLEGIYTDNPISSGTRGSLCCGFYYSNGRYRNGYTNQGNIIASWVGRDGQGFEGWLGRSIGDQGRLEFSYRHQKVSHQFIPNGGTVNDGGAQANLWLRPNLSVTASVQYEQWKFPVLAAGAQTNVTSSVQLTFWPRWRVK